MFRVPDPLARKIRIWGLKNLPSSDVHVEEGGREWDTHVTCKYGLTTSNPDVVRRKIQGFGRFQIRLGEVSLFTTNDEFDVLKVAVTGEKLHELHKLLSELDNEDKHPVYKPHLTIAYIKKGAAKELAGSLAFTGELLWVDELVFSSKSGTKTIVKL